MPQFEYPHNEVISEREDEDQQIGHVEDVLDSMSEEEIDNGTMGGDDRYQVKIGRSSKDVVVEGDRAVFEVPVLLLTENEADVMHIVCQYGLDDGAVSFVGTRDYEGAEYEGELEDWYEDAVLFIKSHFSGKPKTREDMDLDRYLRS
jgi:hypothetical protein